MGDGKNWIFDFDQDLPAGVQCSFHLKSGLRTLKGELISGEKEFSFSTGSPAIVRSYPYEGDRVEEEQAFILTLNAELDEKQVLQLASFSVEGIVEPVPAQMIQGSDREKILKSVGSYTYGSEEDKKNSRVVIIRAQRPFPKDVRVTLIWGKEGKKLQYSVRKDFVAEFSCERETSDSGCVPFGSMSLNFSGLIPFSAAKQVKLTAIGGKLICLNLRLKRVVWRVSVKFVLRGLFRKRQSFKLEIPSGLRDDSNRILSNQKQFPLMVSTAQMPPLAKFSSNFGILEGKKGAVLPITVRSLETSGQIRGKKLRVGEAANVNSMVKWLQQVNHQEQHNHRSEPILALKNGAPTGLENFSIQKPNGSQAFEVMGNPLDKLQGFYIVEVESLRPAASDEVCDWTTDVYPLGGPEAAEDDPFEGPPDPGPTPVRCHARSLLPHLSRTGRPGLCAEAHDGPDGAVPGGRNL